MKDKWAGGGGGGRASESPGSSCRKCFNLQKNFFYKQIDLFLIKKKLGEGVNRGAEIMHACPEKAQKDSVIRSPEVFINLIYLFMV